VRAAPADVAVEARERFYDIAGASAAALRDQIRRLGPRDESGAARDALTVWELEWAYRPAPAGDGCALRDVRVTLTLTVTLPRWTPPAAAPADLRAAWRTYLQRVRVHEAGHRAIAEANARELLAALAAVHRPTCDAARAEAARTAEGIVAAGRARNRAYDVETRHGQTQGVVLGP
jgi:predicted secreted Zn-dependent protease